MRLLSLRGNNSPWPANRTHDIFASVAQSRAFAVILDEMNAARIPGIHAGFRSRSRFRALLAVLLTVCTLGTALAWAWDNHPSLLTDDQAVAALSETAPDSAGLAGETLHDHHCCHGSAHLLGLAFDTALGAMIQPAAAPPFHRAILISHHPEADSKPPRA